MRPLIVAVTVLLSLLLSEALLAATAPPRDLVGWEWRWGDSPRDSSGTPTWLDNADSNDWQAIDFPSNPPGRAEQEHLWLRTVLPEGEWRDPVIYIYSIDLIAQFYLDGEPLYLSLIHI